MQEDTFVSAPRPPVQFTARTRVLAGVMVVRIRLARFGRRNLPFYRIFVADSRSPRDGRHIEVVGHFDPITGARACAVQHAWCLARGAGAPALLGVAADGSARCEAERAFCGSDLAARRQGWQQAPGVEL